MTTELEFSKKYDEEHAKHYFTKHQQGISRKFSNWLEIRMLRKALKLTEKPKTLLDIPSGTGRFWELLGENQESQIFAADNSFEMLLCGFKYRPKSQTSRIAPLQCSAFSIPLKDNAVESIVSIRFFHHLGEEEDRMKTLREMKRVASKNVCISLWIDGNYQASRRQKREARRPKNDYQNRFIIAKEKIEQEFQEMGFEIVGKVNLFKFFSMWTTYVLK